MFNIIATILITAIVSIGIQNFVPLKFFEWFDFSQPKFGTSITTINSTDTISGSRTTINDNFTALNAGKIENATSSVAAITTLSNLVSIGTITTGIWTGTALTVSKGGSGTTTWSAGQVILGNGSNGATTTNGWGTSGQFLTSSGSGIAPSWTTSATDLNIRYDWTAHHSFPSLLTTSASSTNATTTYLYTSSLGVGTATTSSGNLRVSNYLQVDGTASTTNLTVSKTCTNCAKFYSYATSSSITGDGTYTVNVGFTPKLITGYVYLDANANADIICIFQAGDTYQSYQVDGLITGNIGGKDYICYSNQATDDARISLTSFSSTGFTITVNNVAGTFLSGSTIQMTILGY